MSAGRSTVSRWCAFTVERYEPLTHAAMATAFAVGNAGVAWAGSSSRPGAGPLVAAVALVLIFFYRLRVFDEIKDYDTDLIANPERPLARGLITVAEARRAPWILAAVEGTVVVVVASAALSAWAAALLYSLAMYREFGIGRWLRPRMELYAVSHTLVASLLGLTVACLTLGAPPWALPSRVLPFMAANWALFNVFEFSRKTFAPQEERTGVESYSRRLGPRGAVMITVAWAALALAAVAASRIAVLPTLDARSGAALFGLTAVLLAGPYLARPQPRVARWYRSAMSAWAVALYVAIGAVNLAPS